MPETIILTKDELLALWPMSKNIDEAKLNIYILRAQQRELKPFLGEALYFDMLNNLEEQNYVDLINGIDYEYNGNEIFFGGVKPLLSAFSYAQFIKENPIHINRAGNKNKTDENSVEIDARTTGVKSVEAASEAVRLQDEAQRFLQHKQSDYPLYRKGVNINTPTETGFTFSKVPRSIQR